MKKQLTGAALAALLSVTLLPVSACAAAAEGDVANPPLPELNTTEHMQYMNGYEDGSFRPDATITRAEASKLIASLLKEQDVQGDEAFTDVADSAWYRDAVDLMAGYSLVGGYADGTFRPEASITRAEFVTILARLPHTDIGVEREFTDVPASHWAHAAVQTALAQNWVDGYADGTFKPDATITRAEAVTMLNRVLGRTGDQIMAMTGDGIRIMPDVPDTHWAYLQMIEATTDHKFEKADGKETWTSFDKETTTLSAGWHNIVGELFHVNDARQFDKSTVIDGLDLDHNGRYTTGNPELDALLTAAIKNAGFEGMPQEQRLRMVYDYAKKRFGYLGIGAADTSVPGWEIEQALQMFKTDKGNCYSWAGAFTQLARKVGYDAKAIAGTGVSPKGSESVHAWTEITIDGVAYTFDPQIESVYAARYDEHYDLFMKQYGASEWGYQPSEVQAPETGAPTEDKALAALLDKVYAGVDAPAVGRVVVSKENMKNLLGVDTLDIEAGLASEAMITAQAHSIVAVRMKDGADIEAAKKAIKENVDPRKWICVGVRDENVLVENVGNTILLIMDDAAPQQYLKNFQDAMK